MHVARYATKMKINQHFKQKRHASQQHKSVNAGSIRPREDLVSPSTSTSEKKKRKRVSSQKNHDSQGVESQIPITGFKFTFPNESALPSPHTTPSKILKTICLPLPRSTTYSATRQKLKSVARRNVKPSNKRRRLSFESSLPERHESPSSWSEESTSFYQEVENIMKKLERNEQYEQGMEIEENKGGDDPMPAAIHVEQGSILSAEGSNRATNENQQRGLDEIPIISPLVILPSLGAPSPQLYNNRVKSSPLSDPFISDPFTESARLNAQITEKYESVFKGLEKQLVTHMKIHDDRLLSSVLKSLESRVGPLLEKSMASTIASIGSQLNNLFRPEAIPQSSRRYNEAGPSTILVESLQERLQGI